MTAVSTGKLIIRTIPDGNERERLIDFLCSFAKGTPREAVAARLESLPLTLGSAIPADVGKRVLDTLQNLGADAVFLLDGTDRPAGQATAAAPPQPPLTAPATAPPSPAPLNAARPAAQSKTDKVNSLNRDIRVLVTLLLVLVAGLCGASAIWQPALKAASDPDLLLNKLLQKNADKINRTCPRNLTPQLRLDGYVAGDKKMTINYTLLAIDAADVKGDDLRPSVSRTMRQGVCGDEHSAELLQQGVAFVFSVHGKDGGLIFDYQVEHEDCES